MAPAPGEDTAKKVDAANLFATIKEGVKGRGSVREQFHEPDEPPTAVPGLDEASQSILAGVAERTAREEEFLGTKKKAADVRILRQEGGLSDDIDLGSVPQAKLEKGDGSLDDMLRDVQGTSPQTPWDSSVHSFVSQPGSAAAPLTANSPWADLFDDGAAPALDNDDDAVVVVGGTRGGMAASDGAAAARAAEEAAAEEEEAVRMEVRLRIVALMQEMFASDPTFAKKPLSALNKEAVAFIKAGDDARAVAAYAKVFKKIKDGNLTHPELYITHSNRAAAYLNLGLYEEALWDARRCQMLAEAQFARNHERSAAPSYIKGFVRKGFAYIGLRRWRDAKGAFEAGLQYDPFSEDLKRGLEESTQGILKDLIEGRSKEVRALPAPPKKERIGYLPYDAPLHRIHPKDMLPVRLLTPFQAENDYHVKDTYNYMTVQTDIRQPKRHLHYIEDAYFHDTWERALRVAVDRIQAEAKDVRVLNMGAGAGLLAMEALRLGAYHVTCSERWLYLAMVCKEILLANGFSDDQVKVVYKRPCDLALLRDVPVYCNLCVADLLDDGLLASGLIPGLKHALNHLLLPDAIIMPAAADVYIQAVEMRTKDVCGFDVSAVNLHRWHPAYAAGRPLAKESYVPLSEPVHAWHFNLALPPEESESKNVEVEFVRPGLCNALIFWYDLRLIDDIILSTGPESVTKGLKCLRPALQYLPGELRVENGTLLPIQCAHNTVRLRFDVERAEYMHLAKPDASFPRYQFNLLADSVRNEAYYGAIQRVIAKKKAAGEEVHALDLGTGSGLLAMMCARAGADSVVAPELHQALVACARRNVAANGLSTKINVVERDIGLLERGREVRRKGCNVVVADFFDAGLLGDHFVYMLETVKRNVLQPNAAMVPAAATVYCMGIEAYTTEVRGFDFSAFNKYRFQKSYEAALLDNVKHRRLTKPKKVFEYFFDGRRKGLSRENVLKLDVHSTGYMNAIVFWFDLHLDEEESLTTAPRGIGKGGVVLSELHAEDTATVQAAINESISRFKHTLALNPRTELGAQATQSEMMRQTMAEAKTADGSAAEGEGDGASAACKMKAQRGAVGSEHAMGFQASATFAGAREGFIFAMGCEGLGYYLDPSHAEYVAAYEQAAAVAAAVQEEGGWADGEPNPPVRATSGAVNDAAMATATAWVVGSDQAAGFQAAVEFVGSRQAFFFGRGRKGVGYYLDPCADGYAARAAALAHTADAAEDAAQETAARSAAASSSSGGGEQLTDSTRADGEQKDADEYPNHYWGQALQYLERAMQVSAGKKVTVLAKREGQNIHFTLKEGVGHWVGKAPWLIEWGGGASVESPHFQRVHYCQLLVSDFLMRLKCKRFPPIEKDMKMILAHCGSLYLDPAVLCEIYHNFVVLELVHGQPEFCPGASMEAMTKEPLELT